MTTTTNNRPTHTLVHVVDQYPDPENPDYMIDVTEIVGSAWVKENVTYIEVDRNRVLLKGDVIKMFAKKSTA